MTKYIFTILVALQGILMGAVLDTVEIKGVKVPFIYEKSTALPIVNMQIVFQKSGSIENADLPGLAGFSARMLNNGTQKLGAIGFAEELEKRALHISAHAGTETFVYEASSLKETFSQTVEFLSDMFEDPNFSKESFTKAKTLTLGSLSRKENDFDHMGAKYLKSILFSGTPMEHSSLGSVESINKISQKDVETFYQKHMVISRAIVVIGGDVDEKEAEAYAKKALSTLSVGEKEDLDFYVARKDAREKVTYKDTEQAYIYFGSPYHLKVDDKDVYKSKVATYVLGSGGFGSRMMEEIRVKRGLAYSAYCRLSLGNSLNYFTGHLQTKLESADEAKKLVKEVVATFVEKGITQDELDQAKKFILGSEPLRVETLSQRLGRAFMEYYKGVGLGHSKEELKEIEALSLKDVNSFIKKHDEINLLSFSIVTKK